MPRRSPTSAKTNSPTVQSSAWRINLFGGLSAWRGNVETARFQSRKSGGLLAYLAYHLNQTHSRDILIDRIWPDLDADRARVCLSTAAYSLRRQLEPPDIPSGSVLIANRFEARLNPLALTTDLQDFVVNVHEAQNETEPSQRLSRLLHAIGLYSGDLLPGCGEDWVGEARDRMALHYVRSVQTAIQILETNREVEYALELALRASACAPDREEVHYEAIRLLRVLGKDRDAVRQFENFELLLAKRCERKPSRRVMSLVEGLDREGHRSRQLRRSPAPQLENGNDSTRASVNVRDLPPPPAPLTRFFGRQRELDQLLDCLLQNSTYA